MAVKKDIKLLFWYILERMVFLPMNILMPIHEFLMNKVIKTMKSAGVKGIEEELEKIKSEENID